MAAEILVPMALSATSPLVAKLTDRIVKCLSDKKMKDKVKRRLSTYLARAHGEALKMRTFLDYQDGQSIYSYYVHMEIAIDGRVISTDHQHLIFNNYKHIIITGMAGSGKTIILRHLFLSLLGSDEDALPVFLKLRDIASYNNNVSDMIHTTIGIAASDTSLSNIKLALFLDGIDELAPEDRASVCAQLNLLGVSRMVVTSRPLQSYHALDWLPISKVRGLSLDRAAEYVGKLRFLKPDASASLQRDITKSKGTIQSSLSDRPLLLSILALTYSNIASIPRQLSTFYSQAFEALYLIHDGRKGFTRPKRAGMEIVQFKNFMSYFSFVSYRDNKVSFSRETAALIAANSLSFFNIKASADDSVHDAIEVSSVLVRDGTLISFCHRSFQEYLAACFVATCDHRLRKKAFDYTGIRIYADDTWKMALELNEPSVYIDAIYPALLEITNGKESLGTISDWLHFIRNIYSTISSGKMSEGKGDVSHSVGYGLPGDERAKHYGVYDLLESRAVESGNATRSFLGDETTRSIYEIFKEEYENGNSDIKMESGANGPEYSIETTKIRARSRLAKYLMNGGLTDKAFLNQVLMHAKSERESFEEKIDNIF